MVMVVLVVGGGEVDGGGVGDVSDVGAEGCVGGGDMNSDA